MVVISKTNSVVLKFVAVSIMLLGSLQLFAQTRTFKWSDELCDYQGTFNSRMYTLEQIKNTEMLSDPGGFSIETSGTVFSPKDIPKLVVKDLERDYQQKSARLVALNIVKTPYWEDLRRRKLAELKQVYELSKYTMQAYTTPSILSGITGYDACKTKFADPLIAGGDQLINAWLGVNLESRKVNSDPNRLKRIFDEQNASPDRFKYALVEVMTFGWWNCANRSIKYVEYDGTQEREFRKLFIKVRKLGCSEP